MIEFNRNYRHEYMDFKDKNSNEPIKMSCRTFNAFLVNAKSNFSLLVGQKKIKRWVGPKSCHLYRFFFPLKQLCEKARYDMTKILSNLK